MNTYATYSNTSCWSWGANSHGQLGTGNQEDSLEPTEIELLKNQIIIGIVGGGGHTIAITQQKTLLGFGWCSDGQLANNASDYQCTPQPIQDLHNNVRVACGWSHSVAVDDQGNVFVWGSNQFGQLGLDAKPKTQKIPYQIHLSEKIVEVACGLRHTLLLTSHGLVYSMGDGKSGQLGHGEAKNQPSPKIISHFVDNHIMIKSFACGWKHSICLSIEGNVWAMGEGKYGQLGNGKMEFQYLPLLVAELNQVAAVRCCWSTTFALAGNAKLFGFGKNNLGQLGLGHTNNEHLPKEIQHPDWQQTPVKDLACGSEHCLCLTTEGRLYVWGWAEHGQLGLQDTQDKLFPTLLSISRFPGSIQTIACGGGHSMLICKTDI